MVLVGNSDVSNFTSNGLWDPTADLTLADFTIVQKGVTLSDATPLGTLGSQVQTVSGSLNFANGQNPVALYSFTVAPGHFWRVGAELDAQAISSDLRRRPDPLPVGSRPAASCRGYRERRHWAARFTGRSLPVHRIEPWQVLHRSIWSQQSGRATWRIRPAQWDCGKRGANASSAARSVSTWSPIRPTPRSRSPGSTSTGRMRSRPRRQDSRSRFLDPLT